jgi:hypothetical protein
MPPPDLYKFGSENIQSYYTTISDNINLQNSTIADISDKNTELLGKQTIQLQQLKEIEDKEKLLLTRSRMLQISQDRNSYKKKIIYSLIAVIFAIFIFTLVAYIFFSRKIAMAKK